MTETKSILTYTGNKWYAVMQWDYIDKQYVEIVKQPHKHLAYEYINKSNLRNTKVVAYYW